MAKRTQAKRKGDFEDRNHTVPRSQGLSRGKGAMRLCNTEPTRCRGFVYTRQFYQLEEFVCKGRSLARCLGMVKRKMRSVVWIDQKSAKIIETRKSL
jgi:hypothetical protein